MPRGERDPASPRRPLTLQPCSTSSQYSATFSSRHIPLMGDTHTGGSGCASSSSSSSTVRRGSSSSSSSSSAPSSRPSAWEAGRSCSRRRAASRPAFPFMGRGDATTDRTGDAALFRAPTATEAPVGAASPFSPRRPGLTVRTESSDTGALAPDAISSRREGRLQPLLTFPALSPLANERAAPAEPATSAGPRGTPGAGELGDWCGGGSGGGGDGCPRCGGWARVLRSGAGVESVALSAASPLGGAHAQGARPNPTPLPLDPPNERILSPGSSRFQGVCESPPGHRDLTNAPPITAHTRIYTNTI